MIEHFEITDQDGYETVMQKLEKKTVPFKLGFLGIPNQGVLPIFIVQDELFPRGELTDIASWNFICNGVGGHTILDMDFENDRTHEKTAFVINLCPSELFRNKQLKENISRLVGNDPKKCRLGILGKELVDVATGKQPQRADYDRCGGHIGEMDLSVLVLNMVTIELSYRDQHYTDHCMYCRKYSQK